MKKGGNSKGIFGAPASSVALLAAVVAAFQLIPFSVVMGPGTSFPLSLAMHSLIGVVLGPLAGGLSVLIGSTIGIMIAPHTAFLGPFTVLVVTIGAVIGGLIIKGKQQYGGIYLIAAGVLWIVLYLAMMGTPERGLVLFQPWRYFVAGALLFLPAFNRKVRQMLLSENRLHIGVALTYISWVASMADHTISSILGNLILFQLPEEVWYVLIVGIIGAERGVLAIVGAVIGTGVIIGLRSMGIQFPSLQDDK